MLKLFQLGFKKKEAQLQNDRLSHFQTHIRLVTTTVKIYLKYTAKKMKILFIINITYILHNDSVFSVKDLCLPTNS